MGTSHAVTWVWHLSSYPTAPPTRIKLRRCPLPTAVQSPPRFPFFRLNSPGSPCLSPPPIRSSPRAPAELGPVFRGGLTGTEERTRTGTLGRPAARTSAGPQRRGWRGTAPRPPLSPTHPSEPAPRAGPAATATAPRPPPSLLWRRAKHAGT